MHIKIEIPDELSGSAEREENEIYMVLSFDPRDRKCRVHWGGGTLSPLEATNMRDALQKSKYQDMQINILMRSLPGCSVSLDQEGT